MRHLHTLGASLLLAVQAFARTTTYTYRNEYQFDYPITWTYDARAHAVRLLPHGNDKVGVFMLSVWPGVADPLDKALTDSLANVLKTVNFRLAGDAPVARVIESDRSVRIWAVENEQGLRGKLLFGVSIVNGNAMVLIAVTGGDELQELESDLLAVVRSMRRTPDAGRVPAFQPLSTAALARSSAAPAAAASGPRTLMPNEFTFLASLRAKPRPSYIKPGEFYADEQVFRGEFTNLTRADFRQVRLHLKLDYSGYGPKEITMKLDNAKAFKRTSFEKELGALYGSGVTYKVIRVEVE